MQISKLQKIVVNALEDVKGKDIVAFDTSEQSDLFQQIIIATGDSNRQVRALADRVIVDVKAAKGEILSSEGQDGGEWVLVDLGDIVVHVMQATIRSHYKLEELWGKTIIKIKASSKRTFSASPSVEEEEVKIPKRRTLKKASETTDDSEQTATAKKRAPRTSDSAASTSKPRRRSTSDSQLASDKPSKPKARRTTDDTANATAPAKRPRKSTEASAPSTEAKRSVKKTTSASTAGAANKPKAKVISKKAEQELSERMVKPRSKKVVTE